MIAITFALPDESRDLVRRVRLDASSARTRRGVGSHLRGSIEGVPVLIWHVGIGAESVRQQTAVLLKFARPSLLVAAGYGGALQPHLTLGNVVLDWRDEVPKGEVSHPAGVRIGTILTCAVAAETSAEKQRLGESSGALAIDMETAAMAEVCAAAGVPFIGLRSISDRVQDPLPVPMEHWFDLTRQQPAVAALLLYLARNPRQIAPFARFVRGLGQARHQLAEALTMLLPQLHLAYSA